METNLSKIEDRIFHYKNSVRLHALFLDPSDEFDITVHGTPPGHSTKSYLVGVSPEQSKTSETNWPYSSGQKMDYRYVPTPVAGKSKIAALKLSQRTKRLEIELRNCLEPPVNIQHCCLTIEISSSAGEELPVLYTITPSFGLLKP